MKHSHVLHNTILLAPLIIKPREPMKYGKIKLLYHMTPVEGDLAVEYISLCSTLRRSAGQGAESARKTQRVGV